jgi:hypothetical protein
MIAETLWSWEDASLALAADLITKLHIQEAGRHNHHHAKKDLKKNLWE